MELIACGIIAPYNVPNTATLEAAGDTRTQSPSKYGIQVEGIKSSTHVEFMRPLTTLPAI